MTHLLNILIFIVALCWLPFQLFGGALKGIHKEWKIWVNVYIKQEETKVDSTVTFQEQAGYVHFKIVSSYNNRIKLHYYQAGASESCGASITITTTSKERRLELLKQMEKEIKRCIEECTE